MLPSGATVRSYEGQTIGGRDGWRPESLSPQNRRYGSVGTRHQPGPASKPPSCPAATKGKQKADGLNRSKPRCIVGQRRPHRGAAVGLILASEAWKHLLPIYLFSFLFFCSGCGPLVVQNSLRDPTILRQKQQRWVLAAG